MASMWRKQKSTAIPMRKKAGHDPRKSDYHASRTDAFRVWPVIPLVKEAAQVMALPE
jgi:hypothetical protein